MFEGWAGPERRPDRPVPVVVDLARALPPSRVGSGNTPLQVAAFGLNNGDRVPGLLDAWIQMRTGDWYALVRFEATSANAKMSWKLCQLVPRHAVWRRAVPGFKDDRQDRG